MKFITKIILLLVFLFSPVVVNAEERQNFVTIVNPVRKSAYNRDLVKSVLSEYSVVKSLSVPSTWLITFDVLDDIKSLEIFKKMDSNQEIGIFLEVSKNFANKSGVLYHDTGFWHHANSVFLSGYEQDERIQLIDTLFDKFKNELGYYPQSVGSWWTDSFSLTYMKEKYNISSNLGCSDQFSTDGYKIWGQYWSTPFFPSKFHSGIPASDLSDKLDLVTIQWAPRDPLNGYYSSLFSSQDYLITRKELDFEYFKKLINMYTFENKNDYGQVTIGLEADLDPNTYLGEYKKQIAYVSELQKKGIVSLVKMRDFSDWYRKKYPELSPPSKIESEDLLGSKEKFYWYFSPFYRLFYSINDNVKIIKDLRIYKKGLIEPYYLSPNGTFDLSINNPFLFNEVDNEKDIWILPIGTNIETYLDKIILTGKKIKIPKAIKNDKNFLSIKSSKEKIEILFDNNFPILLKGLIIKDYSSEANHFFSQLKFPLYLLNGKGWEYLYKVNYNIPQGEMLALDYLSKQDRGKVLVNDSECLQCSYHTKYKHPAFSNKRNYIKKYSEKPIVYNSELFNSSSNPDGKKIIKKLGIKYIYLVKFEEYIEKLPYSPGDLGIEKIYDSANAEIWKVK